MLAASQTLLCSYSVALVLLLQSARVGGGALCPCKPQYQQFTPVESESDSHESVLVENKQGVVFVCCEYATDEQVNISNLVHQQVGKLQVVGGSIPSINQELKPFIENLTQLMIINVGLGSITLDAFHSANNIKILDLSYNSVHDLRFLSNFTQIQVLVLQENRIKHVNLSTLGHLRQLTILDLSGNFIKDVDWFAASSFKMLHNLLIRNNSVTSLPGFLLVNHTSVHSVDFRHNQISQIHQRTFFGAVSLAKLQLSHNYLTSIPPETYLGIPNLYTLVLSHNLLKTFVYHTDPAGLSLNDTSMYQKFESKVGELRLESNQMRFISKRMQESLRRLTNVEHIHLEINNITYIPSRCFYGLLKLQQVFLSVNRLTAMAPDAYTGLSALENIQLQANRYYLTIDFSQCKGLTSVTSISITNALVKSVKSPLLEGIPHLIRLNLRNNLISSADFFTTFSHKNAYLTYIDLSMNEIEQIDDYTFGGYLEAVEHIDLSNNFLSKIDLSYFTHQHKLTFLDLSYNQIEAVTAIKVRTTNVLSSLRYLNISNNRIKTIDYFQNILLPSLNELIVADNELSTLPECLFADAHIPQGLKKVDYIKNSIVCDCNNAWLSQISKHVDLVISSHCVGGEYFGDTFPLTHCEPHEVHKLERIRCTASSEQPSLGVLLVFAFSNLFLILLIAGQSIRKRCKRDRQQNLLKEGNSNVSELLSRSMRAENLKRNLDINEKHQSRSVVHRDDVEELEITKALLEGTLSTSETCSVRPLGGASRISNYKPPPLTGTKLSKPSIPKNLKLDTDLHADLIRRLHIIEKADHDYPSPGKSRHASFDDLSTEVTPKQILLDNRKGSQSVDDMRTLLTAETELDVAEGGVMSQVLKVYNITSAPNNLVSNSSSGALSSPRIMPSESRSRRGSIFGDTAGRTTLEAIDEVHDDHKHSS